MAKRQNMQKRHDDNRHNRRANDAARLADCRARVAALERECAALIEAHNAQAQIIEAMRQNGQITVIFDSDAPDDRVYTTLATAQGMATQTFWQGAEHMRQSQSQFFFAVGQVWSYIAGLQLLCFANGGDQTSEALASTAAGLLAALDYLDSTLLGLARDPVIEIKPAHMEPMLDQCRHLRDYAKRYIGAGAKDRPAVLAEFRQFVTTVNPGLQPLYYAVAHKPRGGRAVERGTATLIELGARLYRRRADCADYASTERTIRVQLEHKAQRTADEEAALERLRYASVPGYVLQKAMRRHETDGAPGGIVRSE